MYAFAEEWTTNPSIKNAPLVASDSYIFSINNVQSADVTTWQKPVATRIANGTISPFATPALGIAWGHVVYYSAPTVLIFGIAPTGTNFSVYLAASTAANLTNYANWVFLRSDGTFTGTPPSSRSDLKLVTQTAQCWEFSVDHISLDGGAHYHYVMVHGRPNDGVSGNDMVVQITPNDDIRTWDAYVPGQLTKDQWEAAVYPLNTIDGQVSGPGESISSCNNLTNPTAGNYVYANKGHWSLSPPPPSTILYTTYYGAVMDFNNGSDNRHYASCNQPALLQYGALRSSNAIDLSKIRPFCTASSGCWN